MKRDFLRPPDPTNWSPLPRAVFGPVALVLATALAMLFLIAAVKPHTLKVAPAPTKVLMIGDSLTVAKFGEVLRNYLVETYGANNVAVYASCGSSPENWLASEPTFISPCGYREQTARGSSVKDGRIHYRTPKLEDLLASHRPNVLIVQLGTNWMDKLISGSPAKEAEMRSYLDRFIRAAHNRAGLRRIIWITPPDSARYSAKVQRVTANLIKNGAERDHFEIIDSKPMTNYVSGKTGGDGVHYSAEASTLWANRVINRLKRTSGFAGLY